MLKRGRDVTTKLGSNGCSSWIMYHDDGMLLETLPAALWMSPSDTMSSKSSKLLDDATGVICDVISLRGDDSPFN